jgi:hypothetical protein
MKSVANIVSVVFHPLLMCTYGSLTLFFLFKGSIYDFMTTTRLKLIICSMIFSFSFFLPVINMYILYKLGRISTLTIKDQKERTFPYFVTSCFYFGLFYLFLDLSIWPSIKVLVFGAGLAILLTALINMRFKISAHMVGAGGLLGSVIIVSMAIKYNAVPLICVLILICGLIATSRLYLKAHEPRQIYSGFFLGFITQIIIFILFQSFSFI